MHAFPTSRSASRPTVRLAELPDAAAARSQRRARCRLAPRLLARLLAPGVSRRWRPDEHGQTTAEYALLTGAIALVVAAVTAWATSTGKIGRLLDAVFNYLVKAVS